MVEDWNNFLIKISIRLDSINDSLNQKNLPMNLLNDFKIPPDTSNPLNYSINRITFLCKQPDIVIKRKFTYPPEYMHRCPIHNYPEHSMFHHGNSIHMPTSESIRLRGIMIFEYHQSTLPSLIYDTTTVASDKRAIIEEQRNKIEENKLKDQHIIKRKIFFKPLQ